MIKIRKTFIILLLVLISPFALANNQCDLQKEFTGKQWSNIEKAFYKGQKYDLGYTLAAITIVESKAGLYKENKASKSYGITQININTAISRLKYPNNQQSRAILRKKLLSSDELAYKLAIEELQYWYGVRKNWRHVVQSYNAGWKMHYGKPYLTKVIKRLRQLEDCQLS